MTTEQRKPSISSLPRAGLKYGIIAPRAHWYHAVVEGLPFTAQESNGRWTWDPAHEREIIEAFAKARGLKAPTSPRAA
jgi:hypothetical protein